MEAPSISSIREPIQRSSHPVLSDPLAEPMLEIVPSKTNSMEAQIETLSTQDQAVDDRELSPVFALSSPLRDHGPSNSLLDVVSDAPSPPAPMENFVRRTLEMGQSDELKHEFSLKLNNVTYSSPAAAAAINAQIKEARTALSQIRRERKALRSANGIINHGGIAKRDRMRLSRARQRKAEATLLKEACMQREVTRAKQTRIDPKMIQTLDVPMLNGLYGDYRRPQSKMACLNPISALIGTIMNFFYAIPTRLLTHTTQPQIPNHLVPLDGEVVTEDMPTGDERVIQPELEPWGFEGDIVIQKRLDAMARALSEHTQNDPRLKEPGRHSYYVDAAVSREDGLTGLAVVYMSHRQESASPWTVQGYRMHIALEQNDAEAWAIWQALQLVLDKAKADRDSEKPPDPCYLAVIYSDSKSALHSISSNSGGVKVQEIIRQSVELKQLGVGVQLHWVPGHCNVPGNELADLVSKKARLLTWEDGDLS